jgi:large subunit ribosomal protein L29
MANETSRLKQKLREDSDAELLKQIDDLKQEYFQLRIQMATAGLENPKRIWFVKKAIARVETERSRRRLAAQQGEAQ